MKLQYVRWDLQTKYPSRTFALSKLTQIWTLTSLPLVVLLYRFMRRSRSALSWNWRSWGRAVPPGCRLPLRKPSVHSRCFSCRLEPQTRIFSAGFWKQSIVLSVSLSLSLCFLFMAAGFPAPAGEEETSGGLCSASEGEGAAWGALHLVWAWEDPAGPSTRGDQVGGERMFFKLLYNVVISTWNTFEF